MPTHRADQSLWPHPFRLPLGGGWEGHCTAPEHFGDRPSQQHIKESCNLGYASRCEWRPPDYAWDSVRFSVKQECENRISILYACEKAHRPLSHGTLEFDFIQQHWSKAHEDQRLQKLADCFVESYLRKRAEPAAELAAADDK